MAKIFEVQTSSTSLLLLVIWSPSTPGSQKTTIFSRWQRQLRAHWHWNDHSTSCFPNTMTQWHPNTVDPTKNIIHSQTTNPIGTGEVHYNNPSALVPFGKASTTPGASEMPSLLFCTLSRRTSFAVRSIFLTVKKLSHKPPRFKTLWNVKIPRKFQQLFTPRFPISTPHRKMNESLGTWNHDALENDKIPLPGGVYYIFSGWLSDVHFPGSKVEAEISSELPRSKASIFLRVPC